MRVAVLYYPVGNPERLKAISQGIAAGIESQGHQVSIIDVSRDDDRKLTIFEYICLGTEALSFFSGKVPQQIGRYLSSSGIVAGKRCFAFVAKRGPFSGKSLSRLMKQMEGEGMFLKYSEVLRSAGEGQEIGRRLHIG